MVVEPFGRAYAATLAGKVMHLLGLLISHLLILLLLGICHLCALGKDKYQALFQRLAPAYTFHKHGKFFDESAENGAHLTCCQIQGCQNAV